MIKHKQDEDFLNLSMTYRNFYVTLSTHALFGTHLNFIRDLNYLLGDCLAEDYYDET